MKLRPELEAIVDALARSAEISLDVLGDALGPRVASAAEIDAMLAELEARGVRVLAPEGGGGEERLRVVVAIARVLVAELGRRPTQAEIAARAGMTPDEVRSALALAKVMQR